MSDDPIFRVVPIPSDDGPIERSAAERVALAKARTAMQEALEHGGISGLLPDITDSSWTIKELGEP